MVGESRCRCRVCRRDLDPTLVFQRCSACGGQPRLRVRRYECSKCGAEVVSSFVFDGLVFDADYFRRKMADHRQRKRERRERVRALLAGSRSAALLSDPLDLAAAPGLAEALNSLTAGCEAPPGWQPRSSFDLARYQSHIQAHVGANALSLDEIPPLGEDARLDRIWRFIAIIYLAHAGLVQLWQEGQSVMVIQHEADREGRNVFGETESPDGVEGLVG